MSAERTRKYDVVRVRNGWAVERSGLSLEVFPESGQAIEHACRAARADAEAGLQGLVTSQTEPRELHCYTPAPVTRAAPRPWLAASR